MQVHNYMEDMVKDELDSIFDETDDICKCQKCRLDIMVKALNKLPPKYVITDKGRLYTKLKEQEIQFKADVVRELTKAILHISKNPRH
jgi:competence protein ComFB